MYGVWAASSFRYSQELLSFLREQKMNKCKCCCRLWELLLNIFYRYFIHDEEMRKSQIIRFLLLERQTTQIINQRQTTHSSSIDGQTRRTNGPLVPLITSNHQRMPEARVHSLRSTKSSPLVAHETDEQPKPL